MAVHDFVIEALLVTDCWVEAGVRCHCRPRKAIIRNTMPCMCIGAGHEVAAAGRAAVDDGIPGGLMAARWLETTACGIATSAHAWIAAGWDGIGLACWADCCASATWDAPSILAHFLGSARAACMAFFCVARGRIRVQGPWAAGHIVVAGVGAASGAVAVAALLL